MYMCITYIQVYAMKSFKSQFKLKELHKVNMEHDFSTF